MPYISAAGFLLLTLMIGAGFEVADRDVLPTEVLQGRP